MARILRSGRIGTQDELLEALRREGFAATQATLSRDLSRLSARRVSGPDGVRYEIGEDPPPDVAAAVAGLVAAVETNGTLVVVRTLPGSAQAVARAIDVARMPGVLGTIAGDDTVFVAPSRGRGAVPLSRELARLFAPPAAGTRPPRVAARILPAQHAEQPFPGRGRRGAAHR